MDPSADQAHWRAQATQAAINALVYEHNLRPTEHVHITVHRDGDHMVAQIAQHP